MSTPWGWKLPAGKGSFIKDILIMMYFIRKETRKMPL